MAVFKFPSDWMRMQRLSLWRVGLVTAPQALQRWAEESWGATGTTLFMVMLYDATFGSSNLLVPVPEGIGYRIDSSPRNALVTGELADELKRVLERFAMEAGFTESNPVAFFFKPGVVGHHKCGRAADIYAVA